MECTRKDFLLAAGVTASVVALSGCSSLATRVAAPAVPARLPEVEVAPELRRALNRIAFGPRPGDLTRVQEIGLDAYVEEQLAPERLDEGAGCRLRLGLLDTLDLDADDAKDWETSNYPEVGRGVAATDLQKACLIRAVYSPRQLYEVMVDFWTNHFNVSQLKAECSWLKTVDDRVIRRHAMGRFRDLLGASAHSAAMLFYLDNAKNRKRDENGGAEPNENYARELLELHTLGVHGGYTLKDIQEVARCFTGWSYKSGFQWRPGDFAFHSDQHDDDPKVVLGVPIPGGQGLRDGEQVLDLIARHPSTARFLARKLVRRFITDDPEPALVERIAGVFRRTDGDIRRTLAALLHAPELRQGAAQKLKRPLEYVASALRITSANTDAAGVLRHLERMGQLPYKWPMPDGYPDRATPWLSGLLWRWNFALDLVEGRVEGTSVPLEEITKAAGEDPKTAVQRLAHLVAGNRLPEPVAAQMAARAGPVSAGAVRQWLALLLSAPGFQRR